MTKEDYYAILGISRTAKEAEIKKAYRRLARKNHPDVNPGTSRRRSASRGSRKPTTFSAIPRSARSTTNTGFTRKTSGMRREMPGIRGKEALPKDLIFPEWILAALDAGAVFGIFFRIFWQQGRARSRKWTGEGGGPGAPPEHFLHGAIKGFSTRMTLNRQDACSACEGSGFDRAQGRRYVPNAKGPGKR